ncbi:MAG: hypothetical protein PVF54_07180 [Anaerolineae bacterium]
MRSPLPVYLRAKALRQRRVLLVADAVGLTDPLLGEGVRHEVDSGRLAAESLPSADPQGYGKRVQREIGRDLLWGRRWACLFYGYPRPSFGLSVRNPGFVEEFLDLFADETVYR